MLGVDGVGLPKLRFRGIDETLVQAPLRQVQVIVRARVAQGASLHLVGFLEVFTAQSDVFGAQSQLAMRQDDVVTIAQVRNLAADNFAVLEHEQPFLGRKGDRLPRSGDDA